MLLRFRVTNFASLRDEQELSLVALDNHPGVATRAVPRERMQALPAVGVFGKNASGKSNVVKALSFAVRVVRESHQRWLPEEGVPRWPFQLDSRSRDTPSKFVFDLVVDDVRYEYGFAVDDETVCQEWLYAYPHRKRRILFERDDDLTFGDTLTGQREFIAEVVRPNSLFLSAAAANNHKQLSTVHRWFASYLKSLDRPPPNHRPPSVRGLDDRVLGLLRYADLGISGVRMTPPTAEERNVQLELWRSLGIDQQPEAELPSRLALVHDADNEAGDVPLPWRWESSGTRTWFYLVRMVLDALDNGRLLVVDDLGSGLHPLLTAQIIQLFHEPATNRHGAQLVFNSHDVGLLGRHYGVRLARDQVWLTDKDEWGATRLFPLTEFRVRDEVDDVEGRYLKGRYGGVPFFDDELLAALTGRQSE